jgi:hypothetical protein
MAKDDALTLLKSEFKLWGVELQSQTRGNNHIELRWRVSPDKEARSYFIANTPSDHRGWLNARADIRGLFRADGLDLKKLAAKKPSALTKALSVPQPVEPVDDQIRMLRAEVGDLTEMILELTSRLDHVLASKIAAPPAVVAVPEPKASVRSIKAITYVSDNWNSTDAIARDMGLSPTIAYRKLYYLYQQEKIEMDGGRWRKKPGLRVVARK